MLTHTRPALLSISHIQRVMLCLPRFSVPQSVVLTTSPSHLLTVAFKVGMEEGSDSASHAEVVWAKSSWSEVFGKRF